MTKRPSQQDFDDIAEEVESELHTIDSRLNEHELEQALNDMRNGKSPEQFSADPEFQAAVQLHVLTSDAEVHDDFKQQLERRLRERLGVASVPFWKKQWFFPVFSATSVAVVVFAVAGVLMNTGGTGNGNVEIAEQTNTGEGPSGANARIVNGEPENIPEVSQEASLRGPETDQSSDTNSSTEINTEANGGTGGADDSPEDSTNQELPEDSTPDNAEDDLAIGIASADLNQIDVLVADMSSDVAQIESAEAELSAYDDAVKSLEGDSKTLTTGLSSL